MDTFYIAAETDLIKLKLVKETIPSHVGEPVADTLETILTSKEKQDALEIGKHGILIQLLKFYTYTRKDTHLRGQLNSCSEF